MQVIYSSFKIYVEFPKSFINHAHHSTNLKPSTLTQPLKEQNEMEFLPDEDEADAFPAEDEIKRLDSFCAWRDIKQRPEILLWYIGNMLSYLGFYMPFMNLV